MNCIWCKRVFPTAAALMQHTEASHAGGTVATTPLAQGMATAVPDPTVSVRVLCTVCNRQYSGLFAFLQHAVEAHCSAAPTVGPSYMDPFSL